MTEECSTQEDTCPMAAATPPSPHVIALPDFLACLDGDAAPEVVTHFRHCRTCQAAADDYASLQHRLRVRFRRATCPSSVTLGEYAPHVLPSFAQAHLKRHLRDA